MDNNNNWFIGINDKHIDGHFVYESDGIKVSYNPKWLSNYGTKGTAHNCIIFVRSQTSALWADYYCSNGFASICEQNK